MITCFNGWLGTNKQKRLALWASALLLSAPFTGQVHGSGTWFTLSNPAKAAVQPILLLSDGTVMAGNNPPGSVGTAWYRLRPDPLGHYVEGEWSDIASMHDSRQYFASQVLKDGRVLVAGGEYGTGGPTAEIYDPLIDTWTRVNPPVALLDPSQGQAFVDANSKMLPDGRVLIFPVNASTNAPLLIFNPAGNSWTNAPAPGGASLREGSWVKLPDDSILTVATDSLSSGRFIPALNRWISDATVPVSLWAPLSGYAGETGPAFLLPNGKAIFFGGTGHTAIYTPSGATNQGSWSAGPDIPGGLGSADGPGAMMRNGKILLTAAPPPFASGTNPPTFQTPISFFEYDYTVGPSGAFTQVSGPTGLTDPLVTYVTAMLTLPDGSVLYANSTEQNFPATGAKLYIYVPNGAQLASGKPIISSITPNSDGSFHLTGSNLNGISQGAAYGDDLQMDSNYPIIQFQDTNSAHIDYGRTYNWTSTGVVTGPSSVEFTLPAGLIAQTYLVSVSANGIISDPVVFSFINPSSLAICPGGSGSLKAIPSPQPATYQWFFNGLPLSGQTSPELDIVNATTNQSGLYTLQITSGGATVKSAPTPVSVGVWEVSQPPASNAAALCTPTALSVIARGKGTLNAQWFRNNFPILADARVTNSVTALAGGATLFNLSFAETVYQDDASYNIVITDDCGAYVGSSFFLRIIPNPPWFVATTQGPSPRSRAAAAYDFDRKVGVLFGGQTYVQSGSPAAGDTWEFDGIRWTQRFPAVSPQGRDTAQMVYDTRRHRCVLFGGQVYTNSSYQLSLQTWEWDGNNWQRIITSNLPPWTFNDQFAACYDSARGETLIFGGENNTGRLSQLWGYNGTNWTLKTPSGLTPVVRGAPFLAFDSFRNVVVLLGANSQLTNSPYAPAGAVWEWNGALWQEKLQSGQVFGGTYAEQMFTFDTFRSECVLFGDVFGNIDGTLSSYYPFPDGYRFVWRWNGAQWQADPPSPQPGISDFQLYGSFWFDSDSKALVLFGGTGNSPVPVTNWTYEIRYQDTPAVLYQVPLQYALVGHPARISVLTAGAPPIAYQWQKDGVSLADGGVISGSHSNIITLNPSSLTDSGLYVLTLSNRCGFNQTSPIRLVVTTNSDTLAISPGTPPSHNPIITWADTSALLQSATNVTGPWTIITNSPDPFTVNPLLPKQFFRLLR